MQKLYLMRGVENAGTIRVLYINWDIMMDTFFEMKRYDMEQCFFKLCHGNIYCSYDIESSVSKVCFKVMSWSMFLI